MLEKISDPDEYMFFEQGVRGGVIYINKNKHILYLDISNLNGCAIRQYLPINNFKWVKNTNKIEQKLMNIKNNSSTGYVLEVDLEYSQELHDINNDYPLQPLTYQKNGYLIIV